MHQQRGEFEVHAANCPDPARKYRKGEYTIQASPRDASDGHAALEAELRGDFSGTDGGEHPATEEYPAGSFGAAGFLGRVFPCAE